MLRQMLLLNIYDLLKFLPISYPPNVLLVFKNKSKVDPTIGKFVIEAEDKSVINGLFDYYNINPYFYNNYGGVCVCISIFFFIALLFNFIYKKYFLINM